MADNQITGVVVERDPRGRFAKGHARIGGRKPRATEDEVREALHRACPTRQVLAKLAEAVDAGESWAIQLYLAYDWGKPKERVEAEISTERERFLEVVEGLRSLCPDVNDLEDEG